MFGKIESFTKIENKILIQFENTKVEIAIINPEIINFFAATYTEKRDSKAIENLVVEKCNFEVKRETKYIAISTEKLTVKIFDEFKVDIYDSLGNLICEDYRGDRKPFPRRYGNGTLDLLALEGHNVKKYPIPKIMVLKKLEKEMFFYGLGEKTGHLNKRGYHYKMWNTDAAEAHVESLEALYKSIPFFIALKNKQAFGIFFDNTFETYFDFGKENENYYYFSALDGNINYYFIYGPTVRQVIGGYSRLTGTTPLPQLWTLGYQQCRFSYTPEERLMEVADNFRKKDIPCDALYLDIDYMDGYRVFTFDKNKFTDPKKTTDKLMENGYKLVTIIDPAVKKDKGYSIYEKGLKNNYYATDKDGIPYVNDVWAGDSVFPDFSDKETRNWWADNQKILLDYGVSGVWNDMNEPASFNGPLPDDVCFKNDGTPTDSREIHNVYGHLMSKSTYEGIKKYTNKRPFVITRACYAGTQKYSTAWTGDNQSLWEHLRMSLPMLMNLGLSGISFCGSDVGGFSFDCTAELLSRWIQVGAFTPLFRNHSSCFSRDQEPWAFDELTEKICRKYIKLRYKLIPYLYDILWNAENTGLPVIRPLLLSYQQDEETYEINDEFLCGENILVAPIIEQGKTVRTVYLPKGAVWIDFFTKESFDGGQYIMKKAPIDVCPIYIKAGAIIPNYPVQNYIGEKVINELTLDIYPSSLCTSSNYVHYQDDGESFEYRNGQYNLYEFDLENDNDIITLNINYKYTGYEKKYETFKLKINNIEASDVSIDGNKVDFLQFDNGTQFSIKSTNKDMLVRIR